jgi:hypothetical protein
MPSVKTIGISAFHDCKALTTVNMPLVETIDNSAFLHTDLTAIDLPELTSIGRDVFGSNVNLEDVKLPKVKSINGSAFANCWGLVTIDLPEVETLGPIGAVFNGCKKLEDVKLPKVKSIGGNAFAYCTALKSLTFGETVPTLGNSLLFDHAALPTIYVPESALDTYANTTEANWTPELKAKVRAK